MSSSAARAKLLVLGLGALCALAALELGLRAAGGVENFRRRAGSGGPAPGRTTILCYGDDPTPGNRRGYGRFLEREGRRRGAFMSPAASRLYDLAYHLAAFRFGTMLYHRLRDRLAAGA